MSGSLAKAYIGANEACKLYTNSSGNPASVTIHAVATDPTSDACLSMKYSSTNTTIYAESTVDTPTSVTLNDYVTTVIEADPAYLGYTYHQVACDDPGLRTPSLYLDSDATSTILVACVQTGIDGVSGYSSQRVPTTLSDWAVCVGSSCGSDIYCEYSTIFQNVMNFRNFHSANIGQRTNGVLMYCCNASSCTKYTNENWGAIEGGCFCTYNNRQNVGTVQGNYKYYFTGHDCQCCIADRTAFIGFSQGPTTQDIWHEDNPSFSMNLNAACQGGCIATRITAWDGDRNCMMNLQRQGCSASLTNQVYSDGYIRSVQNYCSCAGCCCQTCINKYFAPHYKTVLAGCGIAIFNNAETDCTRAGAAVIGYPADNYYQGDYDCKCCFWTQMSQALSGQPCESCCQQCKVICCFNGSTLKWLTYNPIDNCNYLEIMGSGDLDGIYTVESSCFVLCCGSAVASDATLRCNYQTFETWINDGAFVKVADTPTAWCTRNNMLQPVTQPYQIGTSKWVIWSACHAFGTPLTGGWNGCYYRYESSDLINWTRSDDVGETSTLACSGVGTSLCKLNYIYDGTNITEGKNYYYNTANCVDDSGTLEYQASANRLERTGIVMSDSDTLYISNDSTTPVAVQVWGYDN